MPQRQYHSIDRSKESGVTTWLPMSVNLVNGVLPNRYGSLCIGAQGCPPLVAAYLPGEQTSVGLIRTINLLDSLARGEKPGAGLSHFGGGLKYRKSGGG